MIVTDEKISVEEIKHRLTPIFAERELQLAVLFGSVAAGKTHRHSDIDLAFLFDKPVDILELTNRVTRLLHTDKVDIVDLRKAGPLLKFAAVETGKLLYERELGLYNSFYALASKMYIDTKKLRDTQRVIIQRFLEERGLS